MSRVDGMSCRSNAARVASVCAIAWIASAGGGRAHADAWLATGDVGLRNDVYLLVDSAIIELPLTAWPIPSADLARSVATVDRSKLDAGQLAALARVEARLKQSANFEARVAGAARPIRLRTFDDTPREEGESEIALQGESGRFSGRFELTGVVDPDDDQTIRLDGSHATIQWGNWLLSANALERWWGPGWDGSTILSNNARPVPGISLDRASSAPFESKWLSWIGPWRFTTFMGRMEEEREDHDHPLLFGMRVTFRPFSQFKIGSIRPFRGLEIAGERTAQWCGEGLPCDAEAFWDVLVGNDSLGDTVEEGSEPGNQLAGWTVRWSSPLPKVPFALYRQKTGESARTHSLTFGQPISLWGIESWGTTAAGGSWRAHAEYAATACGEPSRPAFDCAYNNGIFNVEGYRYRGRALGHSADGDSRIYSFGATWITPSAHHWSVLIRDGEINRGGAVPDTRHSVSSEPVDLLNLEMSLRVPRGAAEWRIGLGADQLEPESTGRTERQVRGFAEWRQRF